MSSLRARHANCSVVGCKNQHSDNVPAAVRVSLYKCAYHFTLDCFIKEGQYKAGFASTLTLIKGSVPTIRDPATAPETRVSVAAV